MIYTTVKKKKICEDCGQEFETEKDNHFSCNTCYRKRQKTCLTINGIDFTSCDFYDLGKEFDNYILKDEFKKANLPFTNENLKLIKPIANKRICNYNSLGIKTQINIPILYSLAHNYKIEKSEIFEYVIKNGTIDYDILEQMHEKIN